MVRLSPQPNIIFACRRKFYRYSILGMLKQNQELSRKTNSQLIRLIKQKTQPLKRSRIPQALKTAINSCSRNASPSLMSNSSLPDLTSSANAKRVPTPTLLDRVRHHLHDKRKDNALPFQPADLNDYIQFFDKPTEPITRIKRQSIEFNVALCDEQRRVEYAKTFYQPSVEEPLFDQERNSLMNARMRRKMNHRKIIGLPRRG